MDRCRYSVGLIAKPTRYCQGMRRVAQLGSAEAQAWHPEIDRAFTGQYRDQPAVGRGMAGLC